MNATTENYALTAQLQMALNAMQLLAPFKPRLAGPLAELTADARLSIVLHIQADHSDDVRMFLDEQRIPVRMLETRLRVPRSASQTLPGLGFLAGEQDIVLWIFTPAQFRQRLRVGDESSPSTRLNTKAVQQQLMELTRPD